MTPSLPGASGRTSIILRANQVVSAGASRSTLDSYNLELVNVVGGAHTSWHIRCMRTNTGAKTKTFDITNGISLEGADITQRPFIDSLFRIGGATLHYSGESNISAAAIYSAYLSDSEVNEVATVMRKRMARLGSTV